MENEMKNKIDLLNIGFKRYLQKDYPPIIFEAMGYSLFSGGKRLRAIIMMSLYEHFGGKIMDILPFATGIEMIHTYSLIHDDLPTMDNDDFRRGQPTNHKKYGEAMAILAGDGLLNLAYETILSNCCSSQTIKAAREIASCSGVYGMIGGQVMDIYAETSEITKEELDYIYKNKTGKILKASFTVAGILAGQTDDVIETLEKIGYNYGKAFQIYDDILDIESTTEILGKPVGSDLKNNKATYVTMYGMEEAKNAYTMLERDVLQDLYSITGENAFIYKLVAQSFSRKK